MAREETGTDIVAVVLAAGLSSRMGTSKPLLPLGSKPVLERVIASVAEAGVDDIVAVTGHRAEEVALVLDRLGVHQVHNPHYETGMFSSVLAGVAALGNDVGAFFILPVDCALVTPQVLRALMESYRDTNRGILYPTCCGLRGHPPLIAGRYREELLTTGRAEAETAHGGAEEVSLRSFLMRHPEDEADVEVEDLTILMDMDTPEDHRRMERFAAIMDEAGGPHAGQASLGPEDAVYLLSLLDAPDHLVRHGETVAAVAAALAAALKEQVPALDVERVRSTALVHDMAKGMRRHATFAQTLLDNLGLHLMGSAVGSHMLIPGEELAIPLPTEAQLLYLADKLVSGDRVLSIADRTAEALDRYGQDPESVRAVQTRMRAARSIADRVETILGRPILTEKRIYLVRHARPAAPDGTWRFVGQSDPPLSPCGVSQAHALAEQMTPVHFDAIYSSDLQRCVMTAAIISKDTGPDIQELPELREIDIGRWEGMSVEEVKHRYPADYARRELDLIGFPFPGGESFRDLLTRVTPAFRRIMDSDAQSILVVSHKGVNRALLAHLLGMPLEELFSIPQVYCCVNLIRVVELPDGSRALDVKIAE
ncbi:MAG: histidine phosphatase family protein [Thermoleophilia bacterium]|nr:histidine phosphatase family protein [Thermoleophilia bacterium]